MGSTSGNAAAPGHKETELEEASEGPVAESGHEQSQTVMVMTNTPRKPAAACEEDGSDAATPTRTSHKLRPEGPRRLKKKVPWMGKNILVLLPRDGGRGQPGKPAVPLDEATTQSMMQSWRKRGYKTDGFDLATDARLPGADYGHDATTRPAWPDVDDVAREQARRSYTVLLPDLRAWKHYIDDRTEAKLRALGVSCGDALESRPPPSAAPSVSLSNMSGQVSATPCPPPPFSPPPPTSSVSSSHARAFPLSTVSSPAPCTAQTKARASGLASSPPGWLQHQGAPGVLAKFSSLSLPSPLTPDGSAPQRHQSLPYAVLPHALPPLGRPCLRLHGLAEEAHGPMRSGPASLNTDHKLQHEIDEAEYHLEEQMRCQLDNDRDYSPHFLPKKPGLDAGRAPQQPCFSAPADAVVLQHPRPYSRGHSLPQKHFTEHGACPGLFQSATAMATDKTVAETRDMEAGIVSLAAAPPRRRSGSVASSVSNPWATDRSSHTSTASLSKPSPADPLVLSGSSCAAPPPCVFRAAANSSCEAMFAPGRGRLSLLGPGPKLRPDAPVFQPLLTNSVSEGNAASSVFGNMAETQKLVPKSQAIPIVRPPSDAPFQIAVGGCVKRARASVEPSHDVARLAQPLEAPPVREPRPLSMTDEAKLGGDHEDATAVPGASDAKASPDPASRASTASEPQTSSGMHDLAWPGRGGRGKHTSSTWHPGAVAEPRVEAQTAAEPAKALVADEPADDPFAVEEYATRVPMAQAETALLRSASPEQHESAAPEPSFDDIDAIMRHLNEYPAMGVNRTLGEESQRHQPSSKRRLGPAALAGSSRLQLMPGEPPVPHGNGSDSEDQAKLEQRLHFLDGHVSKLVDGLLAARMGPIEQSLGSIQLVLTAAHGLRARPGARSVSADLQPDAGDETGQQSSKQTEPTRPVQPGDASAAKREHFAMHMRLDSGAKHSGAGKDVAAGDTTRALEARVASLEQRLRAEEAKVESAIAAKRAADDGAADAQRKLQTAETRIEAETMNQSAFAMRVADLEQRLHASEDRAEDEVRGRRAAQDKLAEAQRLLRISSEEEARLRQAVEERQHRIKAIASTHSSASTRLALLEAGQADWQQTHGELPSRLQMLETDLGKARQDAQRWRGEAERLAEAARRHCDDAAAASGENKALHRLVDSLGTQLQENERMREDWRAKFVTLQNEMTKAAGEMMEETARRTKKEQALAARQELLDARLQAEARTRERIETELERLETGERQGKRAVGECYRLETLLSEMRTEKDRLQQAAMRHQAEMQEARESAAREVQAELDRANKARAELEHQIAKQGEQLAQVRQDADTAKARHAILLEAAQKRESSKTQECERRHQEAMAEHWQDKVRQLDERLAETAAAPQHKASRTCQLPDKLSPQALRESILVLQEQLQERESRIEALQQTVAAMDPDAAAKLTTRDHEITWLRELLAVRHADVQDMIAALSRDGHDRNAIRDAAIRLEANLQMEQQEWERAMKGGSDMHLPNMAATIRDANPRLARAVGPLAAAWASWRKAGSLAMASPARPCAPVSAQSTPLRSNPPRPQSLRGGLLTPPDSSLRQTPPGQPLSALASTGRRYTAQDLANRPRPLMPKNAKQAPLGRAQDTALRPATPPMMEASTYDVDAQVEDFDHAGFLDHD